MRQRTSRFESTIQISAYYKASIQDNTFAEFSSKILYSRKLGMVGLSSRKSPILRSSEKLISKLFYREETIKQDENAEDLKGEEDKNEIENPKRGKRKRNRKKKKGKKGKNGDSITLGENSDSDYLDNTEISPTALADDLSKLKETEPIIPKYLVKTYKHNRYLEECIRKEIDKLNDEEFEDLIENFSETIMSPFLSKAAKRKLGKKQKVKPNIGSQWTQYLDKRLESWIWN